MVGLATGRAMISSRLAGGTRGQPSSSPRELIWIKVNLRILLNAQFFLLILIKNSNIFFNLGPGFYTFLKKYIDKLIVTNLLLQLREIVESLAITLLANSGLSALERVANGVESLAKKSLAVNSLKVKIYFIISYISLFPFTHSLNYFTKLTRRTDIRFAGPILIHLNCSVTQKWMNHFVSNRTWIIMLTAKPRFDRPLWQLVAGEASVASFWRQSRFSKSSGRASNAQIGASPIL